jgi:hypothetical protein
MEPNPRFAEFVERFDSSGIAIGFSLPNNDFLFEYDKDGGWYDEKGIYFDCDGVEQPL